jgi:hypothetical protein
MKESLKSEPKAEISWPQESIVEVGAEVDFVYIMRKDGKFTMSPIAEKMHIDYHLEEDEALAVLLEEYDTFFTKLADHFRWAYKSKGNFQLHLYDSDELEKKVREKSASNPIISLDPLMDEGVFGHKVSRGYFLGGMKDFGQVPRPGNLSLPDQAKKIADNLHQIPASITEDDIFSGGSVIASLEGLIFQGVNIAKVVPGIQIGKPKKLSEMGLVIDPVVTYKTTDGVDVFDKIDLGDPRDYLLGASGLVLKLPSGEFGRAPYILPFVSTTARAGIPIEIEKNFALRVLQANLEFFQNTDGKTGKPILLKHMDDNFQIYMHEIYGVDIDTPMSQITMWLMENFDYHWEITKKQGELQEKLEALKLPRNIVFLDVNGTLIPDDSTDGYIKPEDVSKLQELIRALKEKGMSVGLCSDSPLQQLIHFGSNLGIDGPVVAENGNIIFYNGNKIILNGINNVERIKSWLTEHLVEYGYPNVEDCIAPEFGGKSFDNPSIEWAFGANRETSITVFGSEEVMRIVYPMIAKCYPSLTIDYSFSLPGYIGIHQGEFKKQKGICLNTLSLFGHSIVIVGNSMSDWVERDNGVMCAFVAGSRIDEKTAKNCAYVSDKQTIKGVIDILEKLL